MKPFLLFTLLLLFFASANHFEDAKEVLNEWDNPNLEIVSPFVDKSSKQVGKDGEANAQRKAIKDSEERELKDFIDRFYENLDDSYSYDVEYEGEMDYKKRNIGRGGNLNGNRQKQKENRTGKPNKERQLGNVSQTTALLHKQNRTLKLLEDELLKLITEPEANRKNAGKGFGHTWKEIVDKQMAKGRESFGKGTLNKTELLKKQKHDLERMEESLTKIIKKVEDKSKQYVAQPKKVESNTGSVGENLIQANSDSNKRVDQVIDQARLKEAKQKDQELEERIKGWNVDLKADEKLGSPTPYGQQSVGPFVDDIHR